MSRKIILRIMKTILRVVKIILLIVGFETAMPSAAEKVKKRCVYMNQCQDKTNPSLVTGLRCKPYTRNLFDYRWLCELVLGRRVFRGNNCVTRARGNDQMLVEVVVDFFASIQFVRWRYRRGRVFLFLDFWRG